MTSSNSGPQMSNFMLPLDGRTYYFFKTVMALIVWVFFVVLHICLIFIYMRTFVNDLRGGELKKCKYCECKFKQTSARPLNF